MSQESASIARAQPDPVHPHQSTPANAATGRDEAFPGVSGGESAPQIRPEQDSIDVARAAVTLVLPSPPSSNRYWRSFVPRHGTRAIVVVSDEARAYRRDVFKLALAAGVRHPITGRVALGVQLYPARPLDWAKRAAKNPDGWDDTVRSIDLDNALKVLLDALKNVAFEDDSWVRKIDAERMEPDQHGARVIVTISPIVRERVAPELPL